MENRSRLVLDLAEPHPDELASYRNWQGPQRAGLAVYGMRVFPGRLALIHVKQMGRHVV